jgi:hypothetical protein
MDHFYTYPTVVPMPVERLRRVAQELDTQPRGARPESDRLMPAGARPESYSSASSGGSESTAS